MSRYNPVAEEKSFKSTAKAISSLLPKRMKGKLLDIGCFKGYLRQLLPKAVNYTGLDLDSWFPGAVVCDLNDGCLPFETDSFDYIIASNVLEHLFYPEKICEEIKRVMKPDGTAIISLPNDRGLASKLISGNIGLFRNPVSFERQKHAHHWVFSIRTATSFISDYFKIVAMEMNNGHILNKLDFILKHFPNLCSDIYMKVKQREVRK